MTGQNFRPLPPQDDLPTPPAAASSPSAPNPPSRGAGPAAFCLDRAQIILACYPRGAAADPERYAAAVAAILSEYQPAVIERVSDPRTGIAGDVKFLPTVAEIKECCERHKAILDTLSRPTVPRAARPPFVRRPMNPAPAFWSPDRNPVGYQWAVAKHTAEGGTTSRASAAGSHYGPDPTPGGGTPGIWTPTGWVDLWKADGRSAAPKKTEAPAAHAASAPINHQREEDLTF